MAARIREEAGFTILEVLVAFMILSTSLVIASQTVARSVQASARATERQKVLSLIEELRIEKLPLLEHETKISGSDPGLSWTAEPIEGHNPVIASVTVAGPGPSPHAYRFLVAVPSAIDGERDRDGE